MEGTFYSEAVADLKQSLGTEPTLDVAEAPFRTIANYIPQLAWMAQPDGYIVWYNQRWFDYTGTTSQKMAHIDWRPGLTTC